ncbi:MAG: tetratricopeptide repeat protein [Candidatus Binatia bacterium]
MNPKNLIFGLASIILFISACAAETKVQQGRMAMLYGDPNAAIASFQSAAELAPDRLYFSVFPQGTWTYLGRANYAAGRYAEARQALERAVSLYQEDSMAKLYLGLTLMRGGDRPAGLKEIESGLRGLHDWLDYANQYAASSYGQYWDPTNEIRFEIKNSLAMIAGKEIDGQKLIASSEWVGRKIEEEIDIARGQESRDRSRRDESSGN